MEHDSTTQTNYKHTIQFSLAEVTDILRIEAQRRFTISNVIIGSAELEIPDEDADDAGTITLTFLSR